MLPALTSVFFVLLPIPFLDIIVNLSLDNALLVAAAMRLQYISFFFMSFKAILLIQITNINQLYVLTILFDYLLPYFSQLEHSASVESLVLRGKKLNQLIFDSLI